MARSHRGVKNVGTVHIELLLVYLHISASHLSASHLQEYKCKLLANASHLIYTMTMYSLKERARKLLDERGLRSTAPRLAVLCVLMEAQSPLSHTEVLEHLGETDWNPATIYRNLVKLRDGGIALVVNRAEGSDRYVMAGAHHDDHNHPHFFCEDCGRVDCLPAQLTTVIASDVMPDASWARSIQRAKVQLTGTCPECLERATH